MANSERNSLKLWKLFMRTHREVVSMLSERMEQEHGIPLSWFDVLGQLSLAGGRLRMTELADAVLLSTSGLTRLLDRMEKRGLLAREPCQRDRRGFWATLTPEGRRLAKRTMPSHVKSIHAAFYDHLAPGEAAILETALRRVLATRKGGSAETEPPERPSAKQRIPPH